MKVSFASHYNLLVQPRRQMVVLISYYIMVYPVYVHTTCGFADFVLWLYYCYKFSYSKQVAAENNYLYGG
jgi:hypothetical protein